MDGSSPHLFRLRASFPHHPTTINNGTNKIHVQACCSWAGSRCFVLCCQWRHFSQSAPKQASMGWALVFVCSKQGLPFFYFRSDKSRKVRPNAACLDHSIRPVDPCFLGRVKTSTTSFERPNGDFLLPHLVRRISPEICSCDRNSPGTSLGRYR